MSGQNSAIDRQWNFGVPITALALNRRGDWLAVSLGDGSVRLIEANDLADKPREMAVHNGVSLSLQPDADEHAFLSGGDDGKVFIIEPEVDVPTLLVEHSGRWIDHVASSVSGHRAYCEGKKVHLLDEEGAPVAPPFVIESSVGGLAFSPNGKRLAVAHYNGVSLYWVNAKDSSPTKLFWKGSHLSVVWSPDGKIIVASMQENALHGWRLSDNAEMQMQGYAAKIHSMAFTARGKYLATSGSEQAVCWPFFNGGPWNKSPVALGGNEGRRVVSVAPHPKDELVAVGYDDGMIVMAPLDGRMEMMLFPPVASKGANIVGLVWNAEGDCLFAAQEGGQLMLFTLKSVSRAMRG
ncbi:MAG: WD40 repeat domain-containing protein [Alphaproteobacteria bacterium]|nr:WD40 repeat domain-containing protein [Alphaproteobacteria bacterium]